MSENKPRFTGIFIPVEILQIEGLSLFETLLLSWIDALYCSDHGGCYASNDYLGAKLKNTKPNTVAKAITKFRSMGLVEDVSFDGRTRVIRALIHKKVGEIQSKSALDKNPSRVGQKSNAQLDKNPSTTKNIHIREKRKEKRNNNVVVPSNEEIQEFRALDIPKKSAEKVIREHPEKISELPRLILGWQTRESDAKALHVILNSWEDWVKEDSLEERLSKNKSFLDSLGFTDGVKVGCYYVTIGLLSAKPYIEFSATTKAYVFNLSDKNFIKDLKEFCVKKIGMKIKG